MLLRSRVSLSQGDPRGEVPGDQRHSCPQYDWELGEEDRHWRSGHRDGQGHVQIHLRWLNWECQQQITQTSGGNWQVPAIRIEGNLRSKRFYIYFKHVSNDNVLY